MSVKTVIVDGHGSGGTLKVNGEGEIGVAVHTHPPDSEPVSGLPFRQFFTNDGSADGSNDLRVNGSVTPQRFWVKAQNDFDVYIKTVSIQISDNGSALDKFGALAELTNGVRFFYQNVSTGETVIDDNMKTNLDMVRLALGQPAFGTGVNSFKADISGGGADTYLPSIDLSQTFGLPWGLRLQRGSTDILAFEVNDDLSVGIDTFNVIAYGIKVLR